MNLQKKYSREDFLDFVKSFVPGFDKDIRKVKTDRLKVTDTASYLGESPDLDLAVFELKHTSSSDARVTLATEGFRIMKDSANYRALVAYVPEGSDDWRLSLMTATPEKSGKGKVFLKLSNPKRYSFFLGENAKINTPHKFLIKQGSVSNFEDLQSRFSLEVVNKEFYKQISESFIKLVGGTLGTGKKEKKYKALLQLPSVRDHSQTSLEFGVRLIGRIIFCWFLREKRSSDGEPLMPKKLLSLYASKKHSDYYHKVLEPIFFEVLNKPAKSRDDEYTKNSFADIPYLNGGLFSPHEDDFFSYSEGRQAINHNTVIVPDGWFKELFETLETYNFTIDENTSFDEELSIDPEMLGRIFENLLAEINPETGESARKSTGSYYTPRVIVDYMVDESLVLYLKQKTGISEEKIRAVVSYDLTDDTEYPLSEDEKTKIVDALESLTLLDPACGSGAFPIGALQKIVFILQQLDPNGHLWFTKQLAKTPPELKRVLEREFENKNFDYIRKLGIIRENVYGVDIQPIATEISRLRCFLTLIVDERVDDKLENRGIEPLPNLDFKFVTANSLIRLPKMESPQQSMFDDYQGINQLKQIRDQYFTASGIEREQLKTEFVTQQKRLVDQLIKEHGWTGAVKADLTRKLTDWEPFTHKPSDWFDPEWMFGHEDGFDIVIANPPYIDSEGMVNSGQEDLREYISKNYALTKGNWDIYIAFFELGINQIGNHGILTYISPDKWLSKPFGKELRRIYHKNIHALLNGGREIFKSAKVDAIVTIITGYKNIKIKVYEYSENKVKNIRDYDNSLIREPFTLDYLFSKQLSLIEKIESVFSANSLGKLNVENACATSDAYKLKPLIKESNDDNVNDKCLKIINTGTIDKYSSKWGRSKFTYLGKKYLKPIVNKEDFLNKFKNSYSQKSVQSKIIIKGLNLLDACLDEKGNIIPGKSTLIILDTDIEKLKFLLAVLNTPLYLFYLREKYPASSYNKGITFTKDMIKNLPLPGLPRDRWNNYIEKVNEIISLMIKSDFLENESLQIKVEEVQKNLNNQVYSLYNLNREEVEIIEAI